MVSDLRLTNHSRLRSTVVSARLCWKPTNRILPLHNVNNSYRSSLRQLRGAHPAEAGCAQSSTIATERRGPGSVVRPSIQDFRSCDPGSNPGRGTIHHCLSIRILKSADLKECVRAPNDMMSTPVLAYSSMFDSLIPPDASSNTHSLIPSSSSD